MKLIFTRHGESEANILKIISNRNLPHPLTEKGRHQAHLLAERLASHKIAAIYTSPILRAQQTADILAHKLGAPVHLADALREFDCGLVEGRGDDEAWHAHHAVVEAWNKGDYLFCIPEGESFNDLRARFVPFVEGLVKEYAQSDGAVVLISHGSMLHQMLPLVLSNIDADFPHQHPLGNTTCVFAAPQAGQLVCLQWDNIQLMQPKGG
jgi:probable phosphoglycerate mutase